MKTSHTQKLPRLICEMFVELQQAHHGKFRPALVIDRDVDRMRVLFAEGVTFDEAKAVLRWLWLSGTPQSAYWLDRVGTPALFVNAYDTLAEQAAKHFDRPAGAPSVGVAAEGADHIGAWVDPDTALERFNLMTGEQ